MGVSTTKQYLQNDLMKLYRFIEEFRKLMLDEDYDLASSSLGLVQNKLDKVIAKHSDVHFN